jgi:hypothetical protein
MKMAAGMVWRCSGNISESVKAMTNENGGGNQLASMA